jgi:nickel superoxide dismutase
MKRKWVILIVAIAMVTLGGARVGAHCEIPCGIYDDQLRVDLIAEHLTTIEKSMKKIVELSKQNPVNYNQLVRWVSNKEKHANEIQHIVTQYFMTQRIKPDAKKYSEKLAVLHKMLIYAMKCKQTTDVAHVSTLRSLLKEFEILYFGHSDK